MASRAPPLRFDDKLRRVSRALENATRAGALGASGASARFPPLGLAFSGDSEQDEWSFPLDHHAIQTLQTRATPTQHNDGAARVWEMEGASLETRNPRWRAFLGERFDEMRDALGVSSAAQVALSLRKLALIGTGGVLRTHSEDRETRRHNGVFATFVVAMPGLLFEGGSMRCREASEAGSAEHNAFEWASAARASRYDMAFAAFYDHCLVTAEPIASGEAVFLVYDVTTTTPVEVPMFGGASARQRSLDGVLREYFDATPAPLAKRLKRGERSTNLSEQESKVATYLASFCANSGGRYALYQTAVLCSRETVSHTSLDDDSRLVKEDGALQVTLKSPWLKYGESASSKLPSVRVHQEQHVAPLGRCEEVELRDRASAIASDDLAIVRKIHNNFRNTFVATAHGLVVLPVSVADQQLAKVPIGEATAKLRSLLPESREQALAYVRQVLRFRAPWTLSTIELREFSAFVDVVIAINDLQLFKDTVQSVILTDNVQPGFFHAAVDHFGWDTCADTLTERVRTMTSVRGRINLVNAVVNVSSDVAHIQQLLAILVSQHPWTSGAITETSACCGGSLADTLCFADLLLVANACSFEKLLEIASVTCTKALTELVVPAVERLKDQLDLASLEPLVQHLTGQLSRANTLVNNAEFAMVRIPSHCRDCEGLQDFLRSNEAATVMPLMGSGAQIQHMQTVLTRQLRHRDSVTVQALGPNAVCLTKRPQSSLSPSVQSAENTLRELSAAIDNRHRREAW